jgi:hypothetical protein
LFSGASVKIDTLKPGSLVLPQNGTGICSGDSGGPLYQYEQENRLTLIDVASSSDDCDLGGGEFSRIDAGYEWISCSFEKSGLTLPYVESKGRLPNPTCRELAAAEEFVQQNIAHCREYKNGWDLIEGENGAGLCWATTQTACEEFSRHSGGDVYWSENKCQVRDDS